MKTDGSKQAKAPTMGGNNAVRFVEVDEASDGQRIDNFLMKTLKGVPKSKIYRCLRKGEVRVNGGRAKPNAKLSLGDTVRVPPIRMSENEPAKASDSLLEKLYQSIIYEDDLLLVVNKPAGLAVHGGSGVSLGVIEALRQLRSDQKYLELVHRLDRDTSGCLMVAKKPSMLKHLQRFLVEKTELKKHYLAIVHGNWPKRKQVIEVPLSKNVLASGERISQVDREGKPSRTEFDLLAVGQGLSLIEARPITGRTHQIRVHCQYAGFPIVGDSKYGHQEKDQAVPGGSHLMLHASRLEIPSLEKKDKKIVVEAEPDEQFSDLVSFIKQ